MLAKLCEGLFNDHGYHVKNDVRWVEEATLTLEGALPTDPLGLKSDFSVIMYPNLPQSFTSRQEGAMTKREYYRPQFLHTYGPSTSAVFAWGGASLYIWVLRHL